MNEDHPPIAPEEEPPRPFVITLSLIVHCRPVVIESAKQRACQALAGAFGQTEVQPLQCTATHFGYEPDPRNPELPAFASRHEVKRGDAEKVAQASGLPAKPEACATPPQTATP